MQSLAGSDLYSQLAPDVLFSYHGRIYIRILGLTYTPLDLMVLNVSF